MMAVGLLGCVMMPGPGGGGEEVAPSDFTNSSGVLLENLNRLLQGIRASNSVYTVTLFTTLHTYSQNYYVKHLAIQEFHILAS